MQQGLSLIELLIVLAVTGILAAIAYPSYSDQLRRAARSEVVGLLHDAALRLERHRVRTGQYAEGDPALPDGERSGTGEGRDLARSAPPRELPRRPELGHSFEIAL